jgi:hypothetical protein
MFKDHDIDLEYSDIIGRRMERCGEDVSQDEWTEESVDMVDKDNDFSCPNDKSIVTWYINETKEEKNKGPGKLHKIRCKRKEIQEKILSVLDDTEIENGRKIFEVFNNMNPDPNWQERHPCP